MENIKESIIEFTLKATPNPNIIAPVFIKKAGDLFAFAKQLYSDDIHIYESFFIICLKPSGKVIGYSKISQGGIGGTLVDIRLICKYALDSLASGIILAHNHPSGNLKPSLADESITKKIKQALDLFDINLLDHLILTDEGYYSFAENYLL